MSDAQHRTQRLCKQCGKIFFGNPDCTMCPECAKASRAKNVIRERICMDCGRNFEGGPRARRCPECRGIAEKEYRKHRPKVPARRIGSIDICQMCGKEYSVEGGRQKYCPNCQHDASLAWQREHKSGYSKRPESIQARNARRSERRKVCAYCLRPFWSDLPENLCSDYCREQQKKMHQYTGEIKRGIKCNIKALEDAREEYRKKVNETAN